MSILQQIQDARLYFTANTSLAPNIIFVPISRKDELSKAFNASGIKGEMRQVEGMFVLWTAEPCEITAAFAPLKRRKT